VECGSDKKRDDGHEGDGEQDDLATVPLGLLCIAQMLGEVFVRDNSSFIPAAAHNHPFTSQSDTLSKNPEIDNTNPGITEDRYH